MLEKLEAAAKELDTTGEGELTEEELCTAVNQQDKLRASAEEVFKKGERFIFYDLFNDVLQLSISERIFTTLHFQLCPSTEKN